MWSTIPETSISLEKLQLLVDSEKVLRSTGYVLQPLKPEEVEAKKRCLHCGCKCTHTKCLGERIEFVYDRRFFLFTLRPFRMLFRGSESLPDLS